jgi:hypothetical protein
MNCQEIERVLAATRSEMRKLDRLVNEAEFGGNQGGGEGGMNIHLNIERLVLDGVDLRPGQRHLLQSALETELNGLLSPGEMAARLAGGWALAQISAEAIRIVAAAGPDGMGRQIAGSVFRGLIESAGSVRAT